VLQRARAQVDNHRSVDLDSFKLDVALIASTDACLKLASIGDHLPRDLEPRPGLPRRARAAAADLLPVCHFDAQVCPVSMCCWLDVHAEAQGSLSPIDATLLVDVMSIRICIYSF
jgi:hypothetical protein